MTPNNDGGGGSRPEGVNGAHRGISQYLSMSTQMRAYIDSLPEKLSWTDEIRSYQFWKSLRTEFLASFLFVIFSGGHFTKDEDGVRSALALGLAVATLIQCTGHVSGCHLSIAITLGFFVSGRITPVRLAAYLIVQCLGMCLGYLVLQGLFGSVALISPSAELNPSQVFGIEFLSTLLVVLTYLANCDVHRIDLGFKALSIGFSYTVAHLFAVSFTFFLLIDTFF